MAFRTYSARLERSSFNLLFTVVLAASSFGSANGADASVEVVQLDRAQRAIDTLRQKLGLRAEVVAELVTSHPKLVAVAPSADRSSYRLKLETGFVVELTDDELNAVVAHELGHVWIFGQHPYLQTEQLANQVAMRVVSRQSLEAMYVKVDARGRSKRAVARFVDERAR